MSASSYEGAAGDVLNPDWPAGTGSTPQDDVAKKRDSYHGQNGAKAASPPQPNSGADAVKGL